MNIFRNRKHLLFAITVFATTFASSASYGYRYHKRNHYVSGPWGSQPHDKDGKVPEFFTNNNVPAKWSWAWTSGTRKKKISFMNRRIKKCGPYNCSDGARKCLWNKLHRHEHGHARGYKHWGGSSPAHNPAYYPCLYPGNSNNCWWDRCKGCLDC